MINEVVRWIIRTAKGRLTKNYRNR